MTRSDLPVCKYQWGRKFMLKDEKCYSVWLQMITDCLSKTIIKISLLSLYYITIVFWESTFQPWLECSLLWLFFSLRVFPHFSFSIFDIYDTYLRYCYKQYYSKYNKQRTFFPHMSNRGSASQDDCQKAVISTSSCLDCQRLMRRQGFHSLSN